MIPWSLIRVFVGCDVRGHEGDIVGDILSVGNSSVGEIILQRGEDMVKKTTIVVKVDNNNQARVTKKGKRKRKEKKKK